MARKDYYRMLGISRGENFRGIQDAFRDLAKRYHPDRHGPTGTQKFQDIQEAYEILSDAEKRKLDVVRKLRDRIRPVPGNLK